MKKMIRFPVVLVLMTLLLAGCATFDQNTYKSLNIAKVTYTQTMSALGDAYKAGKISEAQKDVIIKVANVYYVAYNAAVKAYEVYHNNPTVTNQDQLIALLNAAAVKLGELIPLLSELNVPVPILTVPKK
jgi:ABC-type glycerol-3-phosphate transport system substrate-binding protein